MRFINKFSSVHALCPFYVLFFNSFLATIRLVLLLLRIFSQSLFNFMYTEKIHRVVTELDFYRKTTLLFICTHTMQMLQVISSQYTYDYMWRSCQFFNRMFLILSLSRCAFLNFEMIQQQHQQKERRYFLCATTHLRQSLIFIYNRFSKYACSYFYREEEKKHTHFILTASG